MITITQDKSLDGVVCLLNSARGIYIPQNFVECFDANEWEIEEDDKAILLSGPEHDEYWDAWADVLDTAECSLLYQGREYTFKLYQDGDLWAYCPELMTRKEWEEFGFDPTDYPCPDGWFELDVCQDCLLYIAYGELPPDTNEERDREIKDGSERLNDPVADGTHLGFSYSECDCCQDGLGGDKYRVYEKEREAGNAT